MFHAMAVAQQDLLQDNCRYQTVSHLGSGASGVVVRAIDRDTNREVAIKLLRRDKIALGYLESEIINHNILRHPQVVKLEDVFLTRDHVCIVMEFASAGNLFDYVQRNKQLKEGVARFFFQQVVMAVDYCHQRGVVNRDIKLENTLLHDSPGWSLPSVKICDFGYSKSDNRSAPKSKVGTVTYMAPEVHCASLQHQYDGKTADIWSCGIMLYVMVYGRYPFALTRPQNGNEGIQALKEVVDDMMNGRLKFPAHIPVSQACRSLISAVLQPDPAKRLTMREIIQDPWFQTNLPAKIVELNNTYLKNNGVGLSVDRIQEVLSAARVARAPPTQLAIGTADTMEEVMLNEAVDYAIQEEGSH